MRWHCGFSERWGSPGAAGWEQLTRTWAPPPASPGALGLQQAGSQGTPVPCKVALGAGLGPLPSSAQEGLKPSHLTLLLSDTLPSCETKPLRTPTLPTAQAEPLHPKNQGQRAEKPQPLGQSPTGGHTESLEAARGRGAEPGLGSSAQFKPLLPPPHWQMGFFGWLIPGVFSSTLSSQIGPFPCCHPSAGMAGAGSGGQRAQRG